MEKLLELKSVGYSYHTVKGETPALTNINFTVYKGEFVAIVGPSGCGNAMGLQRKQRGCSGYEGTQGFSAASVPAHSFGSLP